MTNRKTHCPKGHPYSGKNLHWNTINGVRYQICRTCKAARARKQYLNDPVNRAKRKARALRYYYAKKSGNHKSTVSCEAVDSGDAHNYTAE